MRSGPGTSGGKRSCVIESITGPPLQDVFGTATFMLGIGGSTLPMPSVGSSTPTMPRIGGRTLTQGPSQASGTDVTTTHIPGLHHPSVCLYVY